MSQRLNDSDVERIASRVVQKLVVFAVVIAAILWVGPVIFVAILHAGSTLTRGMPGAVAVAVTAAMIAVPALALVWLWSRRTR